MSHFSRAGKAIALATVASLLSAMPLPAQSNNSSSTPPGSDIGPGELSNFSLNGTVTRPAEQPRAAQPTPAQPTPAQPTPSATPRATTGPTATTERKTAPAAPVVSPPAAVPASRESDLFRRPPTLPDARAANAVGAVQPDLPLGPPDASPALAAEGFSLLPWLVALLAVAGVAIIVFGRQRRRQSAGPAPIDIIGDAVPDSAPRPSPPATEPVAAVGAARRPLPTNLMPPPPVARAQPAPPLQPRPAAIIPGGIVSTGLRPWIDIELTPDRALLDEQGIAIAFELTLFNSGSAAARDVIVEASLLNAGASQDVEMSDFIAASGRPGDPIPQIAPYARIPLRSAVRLARVDVREYEIEGRKLFVPLVAISIRYRWSSGEGQSAAGFMVGQSGEANEKLAPLRLDRGSRSWTGLGARRYEKGLRS